MIICVDRLARFTSTSLPGRNINSVSADVDRLLGPKSLEQLKTLETQINKKLQSNEPIDVEYWEQLLRNISVYKARAELKHVYKAVIDSRLQKLKEEQIAEAELVKEKLALLAYHPDSATQSAGFSLEASSPSESGVAPSLAYLKHLDPEPLLKISVEDKGIDVVGESDFMNKIVSLLACPSQYYSKLTSCNRLQSVSE